MFVLDASFAIDHLEGVSSPKFYLEERSDRTFVMSAPTLLETCIGRLYYRGSDRTPTEILELFSWVEIHSPTERTAAHSMDIVDEIGSEAPKLTVEDAIVLGTGRELDAPIVSADSDHTHEAVKQAQPVEEYRDG
jgi:predicted nucleic acid-binding protein